MVGKQNQLSRREFITTTSTAAGITIVPSRVVSGFGHIPPSDKINVANIGCGTQGIRELPELLQHPQVQVRALCDVNKYATGYIDWSPHGLKNRVRDLLNDQKWGSNLPGIPGGLEITEQIVNTFYERNGNGSKCRIYEDFRELLEKESEIDAIKIMTPDHLHATIAIAAMEKGKHVITHKPIANRLREGRLTIEKARETGVITHLLAWSERPQYHLIKSWIDDGVIGNLREIHNWSYRPVWPQWISSPEDQHRIPEGFNWDLWLGPEQPRPYHPNYTHNVFRGWYDFGGGSIADMGHYSLFPLFQILGIDRAPVALKSYGTTHRTIEDQVCRWVKNDVAFPYSCMIKMSFPQQAQLPPFDLFWYDGGMKPFAPHELEVDDLDIADEGLMIVGDQGKILGGFRGESPRIVPNSAMQAYQGNKEPTEADEEVTRTETWVRALLNDEQPPGNFMEAACITETINLAAVALRTGKKIHYDSALMEITNIKDANQYLTRNYRSGWEL